MANRKNTKGSWKKERASTKTKGSTKAQSNKYRPSPADTSRRPAPGTVTRYWRAGYTRSDGTKVKGHYVNKSS
jgi:hypothetical protein